MHIRTGRQSTHAAANQPKGTHDVTISVDAGKVFHKAQRVFIVKIRVTSGLCDTCLKIIKAMYSTLKAFDMKIPEIYKNLIQSCWDDDPKKRPTFAQIVNDFKTKPEFI